jgi:hypothetical protein
MDDTNATRNRFSGHGPDAADSRRHRKTRRLARTALRSGDELPGRTEGTGRPPLERRTLGGEHPSRAPERPKVNVGRTATPDERHSDLTFAINDAFMRVRRGLQAGVRRLQGAVKQHRTPDRNGRATRCVRRVRVPRIWRWPRDLFSSQQRPRRRLFPAGRGLPYDVCRGNRQEGTAGEDGEAARQARFAGLTPTGRRRAREKRDSADLTTPM